MWKILEKYASSEEIIYIVSDSEPLNGIITHVKEMSIKYKSPNLRYNIFRHIGWGRDINRLTN